MPLPRFTFSLAASLTLATSAVAQTDEPPALVLTSEELENQIDTAMAENGFAGVIFVMKEGETLLAKAYGEADPATGRANKLDTIFGIGSRPIDFTTAAIYLLAQQGKLSLDDRLDKYFPDAPADRAGMTIRHMLTGASGLPDFPAQPGDWDSDLGWIDRAEFEQRTMEVPLLFAPGEGDEHSHWAFGLAAAIIEKVSGENYSTFLRTNFFEPAGMTRTGDYGARGPHAVEDFAVGGGKRVGLPNIPPNWGPTSWLVMGSGGMYSTLGDMRKFYAFVTTGGVLEGEYANHFLRIAANVDGSDRGFELFSFSSEGRDDVTFGFFNKGGPKAVEVLLRPLITMLRAD